MANERRGALQIFLAWLFFLVFSLGYIKVISPHGLATSPDSVYYLAIAESVHQGAGISIPSRKLEDLGSAERVPVTIWPPLYPTLLGKLLPDKPTHFNTQYVSAMLLSLTILFSFLVLQPATGVWAGLLLSLGGTFAVPLLLDYSFVWSETLFVPLYLGQLWASLGYLKGDRSELPHRHYYLYLFAVFQIGLFYTRYAGITLTLLLVWLFWMSRHRKEDLVHFIASGVLFSIPMLYLMSVNYDISGSVSGDVRGASTLGLADNLQHVGSSLRLFFPRNHLPWLLALSVAVLITATLMSTSRAAGQAATGQHAELTATAAFIFAVSYVAFIVALRSSRNFDTIGVRLISPAFPALWIALVCVFCTACGRGLFSLVLRVSSATVILAILWEGSAFYSHVRSQLANNQNPAYPYRQGMLHTNFTHSRNFGELPRLVHHPDIGLEVIASSKPEIVEFITGIPAISLPGNFDMYFLQQLTSPGGETGLLLLKPDEYNYFRQFSADNELAYEEYATREGRLILLPR